MSSGCYFGTVLIVLNSRLYFERLSVKTLKGKCFQTVYILTKTYNYMYLHTNSALHVYHFVMAKKLINFLRLVLVFEAKTT